MPKILLADDSTHAQRMGSKILTAEGVEVISVSNGEAAIKKLKSAEFDLVLADVFMPVRDGYEICQFVKSSAQHAHIPVVLVVGQLEPYDPDRGKRVHADGLLTKPFERSAMVETIGPLLERVGRFKQEKERAAAAASAAAAAEAEAEAQEAAAEPEASAAATATVTRVEVPQEMADQPLGFDESLETPPAPVVAPPAAPTAAAFGAAAAAQEPAPAAPAAAEAAPVEEPAPRWVAQPAQVTEADRARFEEAAPALPERKAEAAPDWGDLLKSVEEETAAPASAVASAQAPPQTTPQEAPRASAAQTESPAPREPERVPEAPAAAPAVAEPARPVAATASAAASVAATETGSGAGGGQAAGGPAGEPAAASAAQAGAPAEPDLLDQEAALIRDAVHACLERALPVLVDEISSEVLRRLGRRD